MNLSREEKETIILFNEASNDCEIWTASEGVLGRLKRAKVDMRQDGGEWKGVVPRSGLVVVVGKRTCYIGGRSQNQFCGEFVKRKKMAPRKPRAARGSGTQNVANKIEDQTLWGKGVMG
jgi:hypothetical protein